MFFFSLFFVICTGDKFCGEISEGMFSNPGEDYVEVHIENALI